MEFAGGRAVKIDADANADALRAVAARDEGASRLGEVALVDGSGRIGPLGRVFYDTLIDENAATHIALGDGYDHPVEDAADKTRVNKSKVHIDFMIGSLELDVDGITKDGQRRAGPSRRRLADLSGPRVASTTAAKRPCFRDLAARAAGSAISGSPLRAMTPALLQPRAGARGAPRRPRRDRRDAAARRGSRARTRARTAVSSGSGRRRRARSRVPLRR